MKKPQYNLTSLKNEVKKRYRNIESYKQTIEQEKTAIKELEFYIKQHEEYNKKISPIELLSK